MQVHSNIGLCTVLFLFLCFFLSVFISYSLSFNPFLSLFVSYYLSLFLTLSLFQFLSLSLSLSSECVQKFLQKILKNEKVRIQFFGENLRRRPGAKNVIRDFQKSFIIIFSHFLSFPSPYQCDQIGQFLKSIRDNFSVKSTQNLC